MRFLSRLAVLLVLGAVAAQGAPKVLCSTFPVYQIARNVMAGSGGPAPTLLLPATMGCPHDYALTPQDMAKLADADILVINGQGMEEFLGAPLKRANAKLAVVDSSVGIKELLAYSHDDGDADEHAGVNPHLFVSPAMAAKLTLNIAAGLAKANPAAAAVYQRNAVAYAAKLDQLAADFVALGKRLKNNRVVAQHGALDYLARDMGLVIAGVVEAHAGQEPSAAAMLDLIKTIREEKVGAVLTEPQYPAKTGQTLAKETGVATAIFDPAASGPEDAPLDYYESTMRRNYDTLAKTLGEK